jgi:hypothetical protein
MDVVSTIKVKQVLIVHVPSSILVHVAQNVRDKFTDF